MIWNNLTISKLYFLFVLILLAVTLVAAKGLLANGVAPYMLTVTPFVLLIGQAAYFAFDKFHFKVNVGLARLSNQRAEIQIGADLELSPEGDDLIIDSLIDALKNWRSDTRVAMRQGHRTVLIAGSRTIVLDLSGPETFGK